MAVELKVPPVGESVTEVQIGQWRKREGDRVERDESVVEIESDKATVDVLAPAAGIIAKMLKQQGEMAAVGEIIGYLNPPDSAGDGKSQSAGATVAVEKRPGASEIGSVQPAPQPTAPVPAAPPSATPTAPTSAPSQPAAAEKRGEKAAAKVAPRIMPAAERLMAQHGIDANTVQGTGPGGRILKEDVQRRIDQGAQLKPPPAPPKDQPPANEAAPSPQSRVTTTQPSRPAAPVTKMPAEKAELEIGPRYLGEANREEEFIVMSPIRRRIAERLVEAQHTAALLTTFNEIDMSEVMALRAKFKESYQEKYGVKLGFMSFFVKASVDALKLVPQVNAEIREPHIVYKNYYDIGIAVGGGKGLVVPILRTPSS
jgi:2-oxoglutarate dehydrogenase E2 component (dihydrolipoamide succinyltransferase)